MLNNLGYETATDRTAILRNLLQPTHYFSLADSD